MFAGLKQSATALGARLYLNYKLGRYLTMSKFHIDISEHELSGEVLLKGEPAPIAFNAKYDVDPAGQTITLDAVTCSKPWMELIAQDFLLHKPLPLPPEAAKWIRRLGML